MVQCWNLFVSEWTFCPFLVVLHIFTYFISVCGIPATTFGPPPCIFNALTVATSTTALGVNPDNLHLMLKNFSNPISAPPPASVTTKPFSPTNFSEILSAKIEELPWAANKIEMLLTYYKTISK